MLTVYVHLCSFPEGNVVTTSIESRKFHCLSFAGCRNSRAPFDRSRDIPSAANAWMSVFRSNYVRDMHRKDIACAVEAW